MLEAVWESNNTKIALNKWNSYYSMLWNMPLMCMFEKTETRLKMHYMKVAPPPVSCTLFWWTYKISDDWKWVVWEISETHRLPWLPLLTMHPEGARPGVIITPTWTKSPGHAFSFWPQGVEFPVHPHNTFRSSILRSMVHVRPSKGCLSIV